MKQFKIIFAVVAVIGFVRGVGLAQNTVIYQAVVAPPTELERLETNTLKVIVKGTAVVGSMSISGAEISVTCKEDTDTSNGRKLYGIAVDISPTGEPRERTILDYGELDSLLSAFDYLSRADWSLTSLNGFNASYTTKAGLKIAAFGSRRGDFIEYRVDNSESNRGISLTINQLSQLRGLVDQAKRKLDEIRPAK